MSVFKEAGEAVLGGIVLLAMLTFAVFVTLLQVVFAALPIVAAALVLYWLATLGGIL